MTVSPLLRPPPSRSVTSMLSSARACLADAEKASTPADRYSCAHLGALRAAAAVLAARSVSHSPAGRASRPTSAWTLLPQVAPELAPWAQFFATSATTRAAVDAGVTSAVDESCAAELLAAVRDFVQVVEVTVAPAQQPIRRAV